jgi:CheY-like chemotaxis protein
MDLSMPIMSGIEASKIIRNQLKLNIPIIAFTANVVEDLQKDIEEAGMNDYLIKPCSHDDLLERIINLI